MHAYEETTQPQPADLHFSISDNSAALNQVKYCEKNKTPPQRTTTITTTAATTTITSSSSSTSSSSTTTTATSSTTMKELKKKRSRGFSYHTFYEVIQLSITQGFAGKDPHTFLSYNLASRPRKNTAVGLVEHRSLQNSEVERRPFPFSTPLRWRSG